jgi:hypothetical protein
MLKNKPNIKFSLKIKNFDLFMSGEQAKILYEISWSEFQQKNDQGRRPTVKYDKEKYFRYQQFKMIGWSNDKGCIEKLGRSMQNF